MASPDLGDRPDLADNALQAREVAECIAALGFEPLVARFDPGAEVPGDSADPVFNLVEDVAEGPDHIHEVTARLEAEGRRYTGARTAALRALGDKRAMKARLVAAGFPVAPDIADGDERTTYIVKSATEHASLGLTAENIVTGAAAARAMIARRRAQFGGDWYAEAYVDGREFNVSMLEQEGTPLCLPLAEIRFIDHLDRPRIVGYDEKWNERSAAFAGTPRVFPAEEQPLFPELRRLALAAWDLFALGGCARVDFRVDGAGRPVILEVNANPCLARDAGFCAAAERAGLSQTNVVRTLLASAH